jgi:ferredoxin--NADP+ reductase
MTPGTSTRPLRVAVIGSGPAAFYTVQHLTQVDDLAVEIDMFERLPAPFGLVRYGVAPDHPKIKSVTAVYEKLAAKPGFRLFGNVEFGNDLTLDDLAAHYHQIAFCTGAQTDRSLGIPGEDLGGSWPATEFVAWYNGHPDFAHLRFDLSHRRAVVVGIGNVAVDVARILCRTPDELARTDIADHALDALRRSAVEEVLLVGRRGPAQAAFTSPEAKELGELEGATVSTLPDEVELDPLSREYLERNPDKSVKRKLEILGSYAGQVEPRRAKRLIVRFLTSPVEILGNGDARVRAVRLVRNELYADEAGGLRSRATDRHELVEAGLVLRSVGYRGTSLPGVPFDERRGVIPNDAGRVIDPATGRPLAGLYVAGWIKRGPSGVIGTNKPDAGETVRAMLADLADAKRLEPAAPEAGAVERRLRQRGARFLTYEDWRAIDAAEVARGKAQGRPRVKFIARSEFLEALEVGR